jgi:hypothetical protein
MVPSRTPIAFEAEGPEPELPDWVRARGVTQIARLSWLFICFRVPLRQAIFVGLHHLFRGDNEGTARTSGPKAL